MKKLFIISAIAMGGLVYSSANAQIRIGLRLGPVRVAAYSQPPVIVEDRPAYVQETRVYNNDGDNYYYLPDVDAYYNVTDRCYVYYNGYSWISAACLPGEYRDYDWRTARRFEVRAPRPYMHADFYRSRYSGHAFYGWAHRENYHRYDGGFANHDRVGYDQRFDRGHEDRDNHGFNRGRDPYNESGDNRSRGGYAQPNRDHDGYRSNNDNRGQGGYSQSDQNNQGQGGYNLPNRGQGGYAQPAQPGNLQGGNQNNGNYGQGGNSQPANGNGGHNRDSRGGDERFSQTSPQGGFSAHRLVRY